MKEATSSTTELVVDTGAASIRGGRRVNEDGYLILCDTRLSAAGGAGVLLAVADGLGGHLGGRVASSIAIDVLRERFADLNGVSPENALEEWLGLAAERILERAAYDPSCEGMGTTLMSVLLRGRRLGFAHAGDSRLYRLRDRRLDQVTTDQNLGARMRAEGAYRPEEYERGPLSAALYGYLGKEPLAVQRGSLSLQPGDVLLLATDGFYDAIHEVELTRLVDRWSDAASFVDEAMNRVRSQDPRDNATVVACAIERLPDEDV